MRPSIGLILRVVGPFVEIGLILAMLQLRGRNYRVLGVPAATLIWIGILFCIGLIIYGNILSRRAVKPRDRWDMPREPR